MNGSAQIPVNEGEELVEKEIRDRFKKMCEGYFDSVSKKLVIEHDVSLHLIADRTWPSLSLQRLQEQDRKNHEAYIRSGEIFEDRQQAYEKMTKNYEKLLASCQRWVHTNGSLLLVSSLHRFVQSLRAIVPPHADP